jgi:hypothetical protein
VEKWKEGGGAEEQRRVDGDEEVGSIQGAHQYLLEGDGYRGLTAVLPRSTRTGEGRLSDGGHYGHKRTAHYTIALIAEHKGSILHHTILILSPISRRGHDISICMAPGYTLDHRDIWINCKTQQDNALFSIPCICDPGPMNPPKDGFLDIFNKTVIRSGLEAKDIPSSSNEFRNGGSIIPVPNMSRCSMLH